MTEVKGQWTFCPICPIYPMSASEVHDRTEQDFKCQRTFIAHTSGGEEDDNDEEAGEEEEEEENFAHRG